jgi:hypothetical protein
MEEKYYGVDHETRKVIYLGTPEDDNFLEEYNFREQMLVRADSEEEALQIYESAHSEEKHNE